MEWVGFFIVFLCGEGGFLYNYSTCMLQSHQYTRKKEGGYEQGGGMDYTYYTWSARERTMQGRTTHGTLWHMTEHLSHYMNLQYVFRSNYIKESIPSRGWEWEWGYTPAVSDGVGQSP